MSVSQTTMCSDSSDKITEPTATPPSGIPSTQQFPRNGTSVSSQQNCFAPQTQQCDGYRGTLVIKVGTSTLMQPNGQNFSLTAVGRLVDAFQALRTLGFHVVFVTSGAVGAGSMHLGLTEKAATLASKQARSAVGQGRLMRLYEDLFSVQNIKVGQLILTRTDVLDRARFLSFQKTLRALLEYNVLPIVNENDSLATEELRFGDNDTLAAYIAVAINARWLFLLTDVECLYSANPTTNVNAKPVPYVHYMDNIYSVFDDEEADAGVGSSWGTGGMRTKIIAAKIATSMGIHTGLCHGHHPESIIEMINYMEKHDTMSSAIRELRAQSYSTFDKQRPLGSVPIAGKASRKNPDSDENSMELSQPNASAKQHPRVASYDSLAQTTAGYTEEAAEQEALYLQQVLGATAPHPSLMTFPTTSAMPYLGTIFEGNYAGHELKDQERWIISLPVRGKIWIEKSAGQAILNRNKSLFIQNILAVEGEFYEGEAVAVYLGEVVKPKRSRARKQRFNGLVISGGGRPRGHMLKSSKGQGLPTKREPKSSNRIVTSPAVEDANVQSDLEHEIGRCIANFSSSDLEKVLGQSQKRCMEILDFESDFNFAYPDNILFVNTSLLFNENSLKVPSSASITNKQQTSEVCSR